jgi:hypothetical protein
MRAPLWLALVASIAGTGAPLAQRGVGITIFEDVNFGGRSATFAREVANLRSTGLDGRVSSLRIAPGEYWEVCDDRDFGGRCQVFTGDQPDLRDSRWNDRISSLRPVRGGGRRPGAPSFPGPALFSPLELFAGRDYSGQRISLSEPTPDLNRRDFNDRAISVRVPRGQSWEVCVNANYDDCRIVDADVPDLAAIGLARLVSSARPHDIRGGRGFDRGPRLVLYQNPGFRGRSVTIDAAVPTLNFFGDLAGSADIAGGRWELCDRPRFGGNCVTVTESVRDLRSLNLRGAIVSVRPR